MNFIIIFSCTDGNAGTIVTSDDYHKVPSEEEHWANYLILLRIIDYVFSPVTSEEDCQYMKVNIHNHENEIQVIIHYIK